MSESFIIGVVAPSYAGKDTLQEHLVSVHGFKHVSHSDIIREECVQQGLVLTRENVLNTGHALRREFGNDVLAVRSLQQIAKNSGRWVITSIRHPAEVLRYRQVDGFHLVSIEAPLHARFTRFLSDQSVKRGESPNVQGFLEAEHREMYCTDSGYSIAHCMLLADSHLVNDDSKEVFLQRMQEWMVRLYGA